MGHHDTPIALHHPRMWHPENALSLPFAAPVLELETESLPLCTGSPRLRHMAYEHNAGFRRDETGTVLLKEVWVTHVLFFAVSTAGTGRYNGSVHTC